MHFDHIAIVCTTLEQGVGYAQNALGVEIPVGGCHPRMGTHNHLLRLGDSAFLEVIAIDPEATPPKRPRWFNLDHLGDVAPKLGTWIVNCTDIDTSLRSAPAACGVAEELTRGDLTWQIAIPLDGSLPYNGAYPTILQWPVGSHPASKMKDLGCDLVRLTIEHPDAVNIEQKLAGFLDDSRISFYPAKKFKIKASIRTPSGLKTL